MESESKRKIIIPDDIHIAWERNFSFLGTFLMGEQHLKVLKKYLGVVYSVCAFFHSRGQIQFFSRESEKIEEGRLLADRCLKDKNYAYLIAKNLVRHTDLINKFLLKERSFSKTNVKNFFSLLNRHFAYHHAVYWAGDYLNSCYSKRADKSLLWILDKARKYNELIFPNIEKWLQKNNADCLLLSPEECVEYICRKNPLTAAELKRRNEAVFVYNTPAKIFVFTGKPARDHREKCVQIFLRELRFSGDSFKGQPAFVGKCRGITRVITNFKELEKVKKGDVLITPMTIPAYSQYIKKAGAIVTDEGGMLSHAAILAREFKIPCVVGTKIATRVLKDGDLVEVDAEKGVVKIIS